MQQFHDPSASSDRIMRLKRQIQEYERGICTERSRMSGFYNIFTFIGIIVTAVVTKPFVAAMVHKGKTFMPNPQSHQIYTQLFNDVYKKSFNVMEPIYRRIAQITGYPAED